jgi:tetratricopeptide (TPR) repeat protein
MWIERKFPESIVFIKKALEIDETNPEYLLTLAKVYSDFSHKASALKAIKTAARLEPENTEIWLTWADIYQKFDELENAVKMIKIAIKKNEDSVLKYRLVALLLEMKNEKEAFPVLSAAMKQEFVQINALFDFYPKAPKNKRLKKLVDDFRKENNLD